MEVGRPCFCQNYHGSCINSPCSIRGFLGIIDNDNDIDDHDDDDDGDVAEVPK